MLESFYIRGKRQHMFFVLINRFRQFGAENFFINSFSIFFKVVKNHLKRENNLIFFSFFQKMRAEQLCLHNLKIT